jgi:ABC-type antimicrobial peptide transport system permease subunit
MGYVIRTSTSPRDMLPSVRAAVRSIDDNLAIAQATTLQETLDAATSRLTFTMILLAVAAAVALLLGVVGIYGVMSYIVSQRTSEIGVRLALGAEPSRVAASIVRQGALVALTGITAGLTAAIAGGRVIESLLYDVSPRDPVVFIAMTITLLAVALVACWLPARRAARLSPIEALRVD